MRTHVDRWNCNVKCLDKINAKLYNCNVIYGPDTREEVAKDSVPEDFYSAE